MEEEKKLVTITLYKKEIFYDMDANSYKRVDASMPEGNPKSRNAIQSDVSETLDGSIMKRLCDKRDAHLRMRMMWCLKGDPVDHVDNIPLDTETYEYCIEVPVSFPGDKLKVLAVKMHEYIVTGSLLDWYHRCGLSDTAMSDELRDIESDITSILRPSGGRRPLQPFGPATKTY